MNRNSDESRAITPRAMVRFVTRTRRGRRAALAILVSTVVLALLIALLDRLLDLPEWVGLACLVLLVSVAVPVLFRMVEAENQTPRE